MVPFKIIILHFLLKFQFDFTVLQVTMSSALGATRSASRPVAAVVEVGVLVIPVVVVVDISPSS